MHLPIPSLAVLAAITRHSAPFAGEQSDLGLLQIKLAQRIRAVPLPLACISFPLLVLVETHRGTEYPPSFRQLLVCPW